MATAEALAPYTELFKISGIMAAVTGVLYLSWLWRARAQSPGPHRHHRAWVLLGWFCPVVNLWLPARTVYEIWVNSGRYRTAERQAAGVIVAVWWTCVLFGVLLAYAFSRSGADSLADAADGPADVGGRVAESVDDLLRLFGSRQVCCR